MDGFGLAAITQFSASIIVLWVTCCPVLWGQQAPDHRLQQLQSQLAAVLRWEVLWNDAPAGFHVPTNGEATVALRWAPDFVSYCSHDVGVCGRYRLLPNRNWLRDADEPLGPGVDPRSAVLTFDGVKAALPAKGGKPLTLGKDGLSGVPSASFGVVWTSRIDTLNRAAIVETYRKIHPAKLESLKEWIGKPVNMAEGDRMVTIACFLPSDPVVNYHVADRVDGEQVILSAFWDNDLEDWVLAGSQDPSQDEQGFNEMKDIINSIACARLAVKDDLTK